MTESQKVEVKEPKVKVSLARKLRIALTSTNNHAETGKSSKELSKKSRKSLKC